eukprot:4350513-Ditylum_brightwellii.AAC.1
MTLALGTRAKPTQQQKLPMQILPPSFLLGCGLYKTLTIMARVGTSIASKAEVFVWLVYALSCLAQH